MKRDDYSRSRASHIVQGRPNPKFSIIWVIALKDIAHIDGVITLFLEFGNGFHVEDQRGGDCSPGSGQQTEGLERGHAVYILEEGRLA